jgi:hypothetical protein
MTSSPIIYKKGSMIRLLDPEYERLIGTYHGYEDAQHGWTIYMSQGRMGAGFDINSDDEYVIDMWRKDSQQFISRCTMKDT